MEFRSWKFQALSPKLKFYREKNISTNSSNITIKSYNLSILLFTLLSSPHGSHHLHNCHLYHHTTMPSLTRLHHHCHNHYIATKIMISFTNATNHWHTNIFIIVEITILLKDGNGVGRGGKMGSSLLPPWFCLES